MLDTARDTDTDWVKIGLDEPYWGVISAERYARRNLDDAAMDEFYTSGQAEIDALVGKVSQTFGAWKTASNALDFGCGVGRLSLAMMKWASSVTGYDISPGMLSLARDRAGGKANLSFTLEFPQGPFDWINSFIVFQHIPPDRGMELLERMLYELAEDGVLTLHFTLYRNAALAPQKPRARTVLGRILRRIVGRPGSTPPPVGSVMMFDYDLGAIAKQLNAHGVNDIRLIHTDHGGHHGAHIIGRRGG